MPSYWFIYITTSNKSFTLVRQIRFHNSATTAGRKTLAASFDSVTFDIPQDKFKMLLKITDWITTGEIYPLKWGDSVDIIEKTFPGSSKEIKWLRKLGYPYIQFDFVEFYFDKSGYIGLGEIVIKNVSVYKGIITKFIDPDWLSDDLTFENVSNKLTELKVDWKIERGPHSTPNIRTISGVLLAFDGDGINDNSAVLIKIYLRKK